MSSDGNDRNLSGDEMDLLTSNQKIKEQEMRDMMSQVANEVAYKSF